MLCAAALAPDWALAGPPTRLDVRAEPSLYPSFHAGTPDYAVRCDAAKRVRLSLAAPAGTSVAVDGRPAQSGRFTAQVGLAPGRATRLTVDSGKRTRTYSVRCLPGDFPNWTAQRSGRPQARYYLVTPIANRVTTGYVAVFDAHGAPVWWMRSTPPPVDAHLLPDGNLAWTHLFVHNPVSGPYEERTLDGHVVRKFSTVGTPTNLHDMRFLPNGNALLITYPPRDGVDLSAWGGPSSATVLDGEIQEIDPQGKLVWRWRTRDHLSLAETGHWLHTLIFDERPIVLSDGRSSYDIVHVNSVDPFGNRLVFSTRYEDAVYEIDRTSHDVVWKLGGRRTPDSLKIVGDPLASKDFGGQHDARVLDGGRTLTLYDNGTLKHRLPRALEFRIDMAKRTATLVRTVRFAKAGSSVCCGSARLLPGENWVVDWGHTRWVTEQTAKGKAVLTLKLAPEWSSYRVEPVLPGGLDRAALRSGMDAMAP